MTIPLFMVRMHGMAAELVGRVLESGYIGQGERVDELERAFGQAIGVEDPPPLTVNSCTSAIDLAMHLIGVGPGDEVITTPQTCTATNSPLLTRGATPVWADVHPDTGLIDPLDVAAKVGPRTKAIIAVDWAGRRCDYGGLRGHGVPVVQDAAHLGPLPLAASHGDYVCYSFQAIKHLTCGDGGALIVPPDQYQRAKLLRWYGLDRESSADFRCQQNITEVGYKYHMNDIAAAIGLANLHTARVSVRRHQDNALRYWDAFQGLERVKVPDYDPECHYWLFTVLVDDVPGFRGHLAARGIATSPVHARNDRHAAFWVAAGGAAHLPGVDRFDSRQVNIPVGWWLSDEDMETVIEAVVSWGMGELSPGAAEELTCQSTAA